MELFGGGQVAAASAIAEAAKSRAADQPRLEEQAKQEATAAAAQRRSRAKGFRSTILTKELLAPGQPPLKQTLGS